MQAVPSARMDAGSGRVLQGRFLAPDPVAWRNKRRVLHSNNFPAGSRDCKGRGGRTPFTRSQESVLQRNDEHEVNGTLSLK